MRREVLKHIKIDGIITLQITGVIEMGQIRAYSTIRIASQSLTLDFSRISSCIKTSVFRTNKVSRRIASEIGSAMTHVKKIRGS